MAKVSIVIPFYNYPELLKQMIESIINQSYEDWELLLVDDGADEMTLECVEAYKIKDSRIKTITRNRLPKGAQTCRNIGLENAKGEYICFFDSDDVVLPNCLKNRVSYMEENPDIDFGVFRAKTYDPINNTEELYLGVRRTSDDIKYFINGFLPFAVWTNIYRTHSLRDSNAYWDENILSLQDADYNIQNILIRNLKYGYGKGEIDYLWRVNHNKNSITKKIKSNDHFDSHLYFLEKLITTTKNRFGSQYDIDLGIRMFSFGIIFSDKFNVQKIKKLIQLGHKYRLRVNNLKAFKFYYFCTKHMRTEFLKNAVQILLFPHLCFKRHRIIRNFILESNI